MSSLLVEVVKIGPIEPHPNADRLEITKVKGWQCIVGKDEFREGDWGIYFPPDSILPDGLIELYKLAYLRDSSQGARLRTVKLRGAISEGLLVPWAKAEEPYRLAPPKEGQQIGERMGVRKWEPPEPKLPSGMKPKVTRHRPNPNFTRYCDPENIKNFPEVFEPTDWVVISEKIHGTNFRAGWVPRHYNGFWGRLKHALLGRFLGEWEWCVGSRNVHLVGGNPVYYKGDPYHRVAAKLRLRDVVPKGHVVYGEIFGPGIQDLAYGKPETDVRFFDIKKDGAYLPADEVEVFLAYHGLPMVPVLYRGRFEGANVAALASGQSLIDPGTIREGCVVKAAEESNTHWRIGRKILKAINEYYLLRKGGTEFH